MAKKKRVGNTTQICSKCGKTKLLQYDFQIMFHYQMDKYYYRTYCYKCQKESMDNWEVCNRKKRQEQQNKLNKTEKYISRNKEYRVKKYNNWVSFVKELGYDKCSKCGYDKCFAALDFHHIDPDTKEFRISDFISKSCNIVENRDKIKKELSKCIMLCSNCHRELHHTEAESR